MCELESANSFKPKPFASITSNVGKPLILAVGNEIDFLLLTAGPQD
jgi:hypothetical protein